MDFDPLRRGDGPSWLPPEFRTNVRNSCHRDVMITAAPFKGSTPRLLALIAPFISIILLQAALAFVSLEVLSSVRAYIAGEGLWTKGQKDAIYFLTLYSETGDPKYYDQFRSAIAIPLSDRSARLALEKT